MQESHIEIILLSKYSAIPEAYQLCFESNTSLQNDAGSQVSTFRSVSFAAPTQRTLNQMDIPEDLDATSDLLNPFKSLNHLLTQEVNKSLLMGNKLHLTVHSKKIFFRSNPNF